MGYHICDVDLLMTQLIKYLCIYYSIIDELYSMILSLTHHNHTLIAMSSNEIKMTRVDEATHVIDVNTGSLKEIIIEDWLETHDFSNIRLLASAAISCITLSMEYELDALKKGARYDAINSSIRWVTGKDESGRGIIDSMEVDINVDVPIGLEKEFKDVVDEHENHCCTILRSLKRGIPIKLNINKI